MVFKQDIRRYVCQKCGIALTKSEYDELWEDLHSPKSEFGEFEELDEQKRKKNKEWKDWYFKRNK
ncbi:MAG: hypothetical protein ACTSWY_04965 [Promethearchaeota archaeon]